MKSSGDERTPPVACRSGPLKLGAARARRRGGRREQPRQSQGRSVPLDGLGLVSETKGEREKPVLKLLKSSTGPKTWRTWVRVQRTPFGATRKPVDIVGQEATRNVCGVLVAMLQGHSWSPTRQSMHGERGNPPGVALTTVHPGRWRAGPCSASYAGRGRSLRSSPRAGKPPTWQREAASSQHGNGMSGVRR